MRTIRNSYRKLVDQVLEGCSEFGEQDRNGKERKGLDAVLVGTQRAGADGIAIKGWVTRH
jgi:hypothetical protein